MNQVGELSVPPKSTVVQATISWAVERREKGFEVDDSLQGGGENRAGPWRCVGACLPISVWRHHSCRCSVQKPKNHTCFLFPSSQNPNSQQLLHLLPPEFVFSRHTPPHLRGQRPATETPHGVYLLVPPSTFGSSSSLFSIKQPEWESHYHDLKSLKYSPWAKNEVFIPHPGLLSPEGCGQPYCSRPHSSAWSSRTAFLWCFHPVRCTVD